MGRRAFQLVHTTYRETHILFGREDAKWKVLYGKVAVWGHLDKGHLRHGAIALLTQYRCMGPEVLIIYYGNGWGKPPDHLIADWWSTVSIR